MYSLLFDRKSLILLVAGLGTAGFLLFVAGLLTGVSWGLPAQAGTVGAPPSPALPAAFPSFQPCPSAPESEAGREELAVEEEPAYEEPVPMLEAEAREQRRQEPPPAELRASLPPVAEPVAREEESLAAAPSETVAAPPLVLAKLEPAGLVPEPSAATLGERAAVYSLQIGAFRLAENSERIVKDLQSRGYDAYVVEEAGGRSIRTVRVGRYAVREEALRAAVDFRRREGTEVIIRRLGLGAVRLTSW